MSAHEFTDEIERRGVLTARLVAKLREQLTALNEPTSARAVAMQLMRNKHLTEQQTTDALNALVVRGVNIDAVTESSPVLSDVIIDEPENDAGDGSDGSSIFAPFLTADAPTSSSSDSLGRSEDDEFSLVPLEEGLLPALSGWTVEESPISTQQNDPHQEAAERNRRIEEESAHNFPIDAPAAAPQAPRRLAEGADGSTPDRIRPPKRIIRKNEWDSPLIFIGGGALLLLVLCGVTVWLLIRGRSVDEQLQLAKQAADRGAYPQAIELYEAFLANYSRHAERSATRVKLATIRLRRDFESGDLERTLTTAQEELPAVEGEEKFAEMAHEELAALLPQLAAKLASKAETAVNADQSKEWIDRANAALALTSNTKYIPAALSNKTQLIEVRATLARIVRRDQRQLHLQRALDEMAAAIEAGDTNAAYASHRRLLEQHPVLASDTALSERIKSTAAAEKTRIRFVTAEQPAETSDRPTPWAASLALAHRRGGTGAPPAGGAAAVCVQVDGAAYGLEAASGRLLWRRLIGADRRPGPPASPIAIGNDVLVTDAATHALLRLDAATGQFRWRSVVGETFSQPIVIKNHVYLAGISGKLHVIDVESGQRLGHVEFPQPLRAAPAVDRQERWLYITGEHSSLYCLSLSDLHCLGVYFLGHSAGSIQVPPVMMQDKLAVLENDGVATCRLRLMSVDAEGSIGGQVTERRLTGLAASPPLFTGRRLIVVTDRGQFDAYEVGAGTADAALTLIATREATDEQPLVRFVTIADGHLWIADRQLAKHAVLPTGNRLPLISTDNDYRDATFDHPLQVQGRTLVHVHRPKGRPGFIVAAMDSREGRVLWETSLAVPLAGPPLTETSVQTITAVSANGDVFRLDAAAIRARVLDQPLAAQGTPAQPPALRSSVELGGGRTAFSAPGADKILIVDSAQNTPSGRWITLPGRLAAPVGRFGEGLLAPLALGQVLYVSPAGGKSLATAFQPSVEPGTAMQYTQPGVEDSGRNQFVISDGREKVYLVSLVDQPQPHLQAVADVNIVTDPVVSQMVLRGDVALGVTKTARLLRFRVPSLEQVGETQLPAALVWGPFAVGRYVLIATADGQLLSFSADGNAAWSARLEHGELVGAPLHSGDELVLAYRKGVVERRTLQDGRSVASADMSVPLAAGPVQFLNRIVLTGHDGGLFIVDRP